MLGHVFANTSTFICILQYQYNILPLWSLSQQCFKTKSPGGFFKHILLDPSALTPRAPLFSVSCFGGRMRQKTRMLPRSSWWNLITSIWGTGVYHRFGIVVIFVFYWRCWKRSCCHRIPSTCLRWMRWPFEAFFYVFSTPKSSRNLRGLRTLAPCRTVWSLFIHLENIFLTTLSCWVASLTAEHSNWMQLSSWDWLISIGVGVESSFCHLFIILVANTLIFTVTWCLVTEFWPCTQPNHRIRHWLEYQDHGRDLRDRVAMIGRSSWKHSWHDVETVFFCFERCKQLVHMINHGKPHPGVLGTNRISSIPRAMQDHKTNTTRFHAIQAQTRTCNP